MGTSCNYGGGPKWSSVKNAVTRTSAEGHLTPTKAAQVVNSFVSQLHGSGGLGSTGTAAPGDTGARGGSGGRSGGGPRSEEDEEVGEDVAEPEEARSAAERLAPRKGSATLYQTSKSMGSKMHFGTSEWSHAQTKLRRK